MQWRIQGRGPGSPPPLILRPNWGPKGRKKFFWRPPPFQNPSNFLLSVESGMRKPGLWNLLLPKPAIKNDWKPESKIHWPRIRNSVPGIQNPQHGIQNVILSRITYYPGGGGLLPYKWLMGMFRWVGSHFDDWSDYNGVAFSIELLEWGRTKSNFWA